MYIFWLVIMAYLYFKPFRESLTCINKFLYCGLNCGLERLFNRHCLIIFVDTEKDFLCYCCVGIHDRLEFYSFVILSSSFKRVGILNAPCMFFIKEAAISKLMPIDET